MAIGVYARVHTVGVSDLMRRMALTETQEYS